jgi:hypothetical protein
MLVVDVGIVRRGAIEVIGVTGVIGEAAFKCCVCASRGVCTICVYCMMGSPCKRGTLRRLA